MNILNIAKLFKHFIYVNFVVFETGFHVVPACLKLTRAEGDSEILILLRPSP